LKENLKQDVLDLEWLILAFLGTVFFSGAGVLDKLLLSKCTNDSKAYIVCQVLVQQLFTIPVLLIEGPKFMYPESLIALLFGCLQIFPTFFYMKAMQTEEASKVSAMEYVYPIFVFIGSVFLFGEVLNLKCCAGGLLLIVGTLLLSYKKKAVRSGSNSHGPKILPNLIALSSTIKPFMSYWILTAIYYLALKYLLVSMDEWHLYTWSSLGGLIVVLPLLSKQSIRSEVTDFFAGGGVAVGGLISEEILQFLGLIFSIFAYAIGSVTLVSSVGALQPILTVLLILVMGVLAPKLAKEMNERTDRRALMQKGISFLVVMIGIYFVS
jgi:drug/metabolite transporter (DMT)-like permease